MTRLLVFLLICLAPICSLAAQSVENSMPAPLPYKEHLLKNGLKLITHEDHSTPIVNLQVWYHVGAKDEEGGQTGFAHLFEHLMFKGSSNVDPEEHSNSITSIGGIANAYTTDDVTVYWQTFPSNYLEMVMWLEADRLKSLDVSRENFLSEREVVKEERRVRIESPPYGDLFETLYSKAFDVHPYRHLAIGSMEDLDRATVEDVSKFHKTFYVPNNAYIVIAGNFDTDQALAWVKQYFGSIPIGKNAVPRVHVMEPEHSGERRVSIQKEVPLPAYLAGYYVPEDGHPDSYPLIITSSILSGGRSSRLYQSLVYQEQIALQADAGASFREHPNLFFAILIMNQGKSIDAGEALLNSHLKKIMEEPVSLSELKKAKNQVRADYILHRQSVREKASALGHAAVIHQDTSSANAELELFLKVSQADIMRVSRKYFDPQNRTVVSVVPPNQKR